jgi:hypothetical protein
MTVTPDNLGGVADVVRWLVENPEEFFMISFQPIAQVGRTEDGLGDSVDVERLWQEIARGIYGDASAASVARLLSGQKWLGHPGCNRFVHGIVARRVDDGRVTAATFHPVWTQLMTGGRVPAAIRRASFRRDSRRTGTGGGLVTRAPCSCAQCGAVCLHWLNRCRRLHCAGWPSWRADD